MRNFHDNPARGRVSANHVNGSVTTINEIDDKNMHIYILAQSDKKCFNANRRKGEEGTMPLLQFGGNRRMKKLICMLTAAILVCGTFARGESGWYNTGEIELDFAGGLADLEIPAFNVDLTIPPFDTELGKLTQVDLVVTIYALEYMVSRRSVLSDIGTKLQLLDEQEGEVMTEYFGPVTYQPAPVENPSSDLARYVIGDNAGVIPQTFEISITTEGDLAHIMEDITHGTLRIIQTIDGDITSRNVDATFHVTYYYTNPVPEPATASLALAGVALLFARRRRKKV